MPYYEIIPAVIEQFAETSIGIVANIAIFAASLTATVEHLFGWPTT
jgi:hypothetical protein